MTKIHIEFPGDDDLHEVQLPGVPRAGDRVFYRHPTGQLYWRVTEVEWNAEDGHVLINVESAEPPAN